MTASGFQSANKNDVISHISKEQSSKNKSCDSFDDPQNMSQKVHVPVTIHILDKPENYQSPTFPCELRPYKAIHERDLRRHKNSMHKIAYTCKRYDKQLNLMDDLKTHRHEDHQASGTFHKRKALDRPPKLDNYTHDKSQLRVEKKINIFQRILR